MRAFIPMGRVHTKGDERGANVVVVDPQLERQLFIGDVWRGRTFGTLERLLKLEDHARGDVVFEQHIDETVRILELFLETGRVENWVNRLIKTPAKWQLVVRHYDKPGVLATVLGFLKEDNVNAEEIENVIFEGARAACCTIQVDTRPSSETLEKISALTGQVIHSELMNIG